MGIKDEGGGSGKDEERGASRGRRILMTMMVTFVSLSACQLFFSLTCLSVCLSKRCWTVNGKK